MMKAAATQTKYFIDHQIRLRHQNNDLVCRGSILAHDHLRIFYPTSTIYCAIVHTFWQQGGTPREHTTHDTAALPGHGSTSVDDDGPAFAAHNLAASTAGRACSAVSVSAAGCTIRTLAIRVGGWVPGGPAQVG